MARPLKEVNEELLKQLASLHCSDEEIARILKVSVDTLHRRYADVIEECRSNTKAKLRKAQIDRALKGSDRLLEFLGKQLLGQADKKELSTDEEKGFRIIIEDYLKK